MPKTTSQLFKKLLIISLILIISGSFITALWAYFIDARSIQQVLKDKIISIASTGATQIDGDVADD